jgi:hypothetical protein
MTSISIDTTNNNNNNFNSISSPIMMSSNNNNNINDDNQEMKNTIQFKVYSKQHDIRRLVAPADCTFQQLLTLFETASGKKVDILQVIDRLVLCC